MGRSFQLQVDPKPWLEGCGLLVLWVQCFGASGVERSQVGVQGLGFRVQGSGFRV